MNDDGRTKSALASFLDFLKDIGKAIAGALMRYVIAFGVGTGASALVCLYYGLPLALSLIGGFIVLGIALALMSEGSFY